VETKTPTTIVPFTFVDGRKYILAETEELPEPEIFARLTPPPRTVSQLTQWRLFLSRELELLVIATVVGALCGCGLGMWFIEGFAFIGSMIGAFFLIISPSIVSALFRIRLAARNSSNIIHLLQNGLVGKGRFYSMASTGKTVNGLMEVELKYQFTAADGKTRYASLCVTEMRKLLELSSESLRLVFYDPVGASRNLLFDTLPKGTKFDSTSATFCTSPWFLIGQIFGLCIAVAAIPAIIFGVYVFLC